MHFAVHIKCADCLSCVHASWDALSGTQTGQTLVSSTAPPLTRVGDQSRKESCHQVGLVALWTCFRSLFTVHNLVKAVGLSRTPLS